jgi:lipid-binding SYLF domain-containing protein
MNYAPIIPLITIGSFLAGSFLYTLIIAKKEPTTWYEFFAMVGCSVSAGLVGFTLSTLLTYLAS